MAFQELESENESLKETNKQQSLNYQGERMKIN